MRTEQPRENESEALPIDSAERKKYPIYSGFLAYFPHAIASVANLSYEANEQHHPGEGLHWDMGKSSDSKDCLARHTIDEILSKTKEDRVEEARRMAWRAMENLQRLLTGNCQYNKETK